MKIYRGETPQYLALSEISAIRERNPEETSPEVQNEGHQWPHKKEFMSSKFFSKKSAVLRTVATANLHVCYDQMSLQEINISKQIQSATETSKSAVARTQTNSTEKLNLYLYLLLNREILPLTQPRNLPLTQPRNSTSNSTEKLYLLLNRKILPLTQPRNSTSNSAEKLYH